MERGENGPATISWGLLSNSKVVLPEPKGSPEEKMGIPNALKWRGSTKRKNIKNEKKWGGWDPRMVELGTRR